MLTTDQISDLIRRKCKIPIRRTNQGLTNFSKEEQLQILAHLINQEEDLKKRRVKTSGANTDDGG